MWLTNPYRFGLAEAGEAEYWRIRPWAAQTRTVAITELVFADSPGGAQLATGGTAFSSVLASPENAFDGNGVSLSSDSAGLTNFSRVLGYQFTSPVRPVEIRITNSYIVATNGPLLFWVDQSADNVNWTTTALCKPSSLWTTLSEVKTFTINPLVFPTASRTYARCWRINITATGSGFVRNFSKFEFRDGPGGTVMNTTIGGFADNEQTSPFYPVLTNTTNSWYPSSSLPRQCGYVWEEPMPNPGDRIAIQSGTTPTNMPTEFDIQWSSDGYTWNTSRSYTGVSWSSGQVQEFLLD